MPRGTAELKAACGAPSATVSHEEQLSQAEQGPRLSLTLSVHPPPPACGPGSCGAWGVPGACGTHQLLQEAHFLTWDVQERTPFLLFPPWFLAHSQGRECPERSFLPSLVAFSQGYPCRFFTTSWSFSLWKASCLLTFPSISLSEAISGFKLHLQDDTHSLILQCPLCTRVCAQCRRSTLCFPQQSRGVHRLQKTSNVSVMLRVQPAWP